MDFENRNNSQDTQQDTTNATHEQISKDPFQPQAPDMMSQQTYATYQEWMEQERKHQKKNAKKRNYKKPLVITGSVVAACALLASGIAIGGAIAHPQSVAVTADYNTNLPSVNISNPSNTTSAATQGLSGEEVYAKVSPSVVSVQAISLEDGSGGTGSGVIMSEDGYIITNNHVISNEKTNAPLDKITVILSDGTNLPAQIIGRDQQTDLAVLKVSPDANLVAAEFGDSTALKPGEAVYAIGSPGGIELANTITGGQISAINRDITIDDRVMSLIQTDAAINPGNSGGALINKYGQVIGITSAKLGISYFEGLGFAIPMDTAKTIVDELIQYGYIKGRPMIGLSGRDMTEQESAAYGLPMGVRVASVDSRSNAVAAGVQRNDIITGINGKDITTMEEVNEVKDTMKAGDKITLKLYRISTGKEMTVTFALNDQHDLEGDDPAAQQQQQQQQNPYSYSNPFSYFFGW